jgi:hypothetical protein
MLRNRFALCVVLLAATAAAQDTVPVSIGERQLFLDDHGISKIDGLQRTLHQPEKRGAVIKPNQPWETTLQTRCAPVWDEQAKRYKLWLITSTPAPGVAGTTYAESVDGVNWTKPILRQWKYQDSLENNFVAVEPDSAWPANAMENVVYDPDDADPQRRFKGFMGAFGRQPIVSPDGIHWNKLDVPVLPSSDESNLSYDRQSRSFIATLKTSGPFGRSHGIWTSKDFQTWTNTGVLIHADEEDQRLAKANILKRLADDQFQQPRYNDPADYNADIYNIGVFRYEGLYVAMPAVYHATGKIPIGNTDGFHLVQLRSSRNLQTWQHVGDRKTFIGPSPVKGGAFDLTQLLPPSAPIVRDDELWFYYTGIKYRAEPAQPESGGIGAICLAVLRRDGFVSLDAGDEPGTLLTKPFVLAGTTLHVNVDARAGELGVTVLGEDGQAVAVAEPVTGNQLHTALRWKSGNLNSVKGKSVSLQLSLRKAQLYSFWSE